MSKRAMPDLILGTVNSYLFYEIEPFLATLRQSGFAGHACLFVGPNISRRARAKIRGYGVEIVDYREEFPFVDAPHPRSPRQLPDPIYIFNYRHFLYRDYLLKHEGAYRNVLITDVKDVVFQKDPFDFDIGERLHVAMENRAIPVGDCVWTSSWIVSGFGAAALERVRLAELSCAGTTVGPAALIMLYLELMLKHIARMEDAWESADQAAHNLLLHDGAFNPVKCEYNFEGPLLTVGTEPQYRLDGDNRLINRDGSLVAIVHQYDRHPALIALVAKRLRRSALRRWAARTAFRIARRWQIERRRIKAPRDFVGGHSDSARD